MNRARRIGAGLLVVAGCIVVLLASLAVWLNRTVVSTNGWVETVGPLSREEAVATALADNLTEAIADAVNIDEYAAENLPEKAQPLVAPVGAAVQDFVRGTIEDLILSDEFNAIWVEANRHAQSQLVQLLEDEPSASDDVQEVVLDLQSAVEKADAQLQTSGVDLFDGDVPNDVGQFRLFGDAQVENARTLWDVLEASDWLLALVAGVLFVAAVALSPRRRRTGIQIGIGVAATIALFGVAVALAGNLLFDGIEVDTTRAAVDATWDDVREGLVNQTLLLIVSGLLVAIGLWVTGPTQRAARLRVFGNRRLSAIRSERLDEGRLGRMSAVARRHRRWIDIGALALTIVVLLLLPELTAWVVIVAAIVLVVFVGVVELLAGPGAVRSAEDLPA